MGRRVNPGANVRMEPDWPPMYCVHMVTTGFRQSAVPPHRTETEAERHARIQREATVIAQAEADIDAGLGIDDDDLEQWLDALEHDETAPLPAPRNSGPAFR